MLTQKERAKMLQNQIWHDVAMREAERDKTDPFIYARTICHLRNGVMQVADYNQG